MIFSLTVGRVWKILLNPLISVITFQDNAPQQEDTKLTNGVVRFFHGSRRILCAAIFTLCLTCIIGSQANAATWYVATNGSDSNPGTSSAKPFLTLSQAVNTASNNDTVVVADGTYSGPKNRNVDFGGVDLIIQSISGNPARCMIDCQKSGCAFILQNNQTANSAISGFTIKNGTGYNGAGGGIFISANDVKPVISNCIFTGNLASYYGGGMYWGTAIDCIFTGNTSNPDYGGFGGGGGMYGGRAKNCVFAGNSTKSGASGGGIYGGTTTNCTFTGNSAYSGGGMYNGTAVNCIFTNNSAEISGGGISASIAASCVFTGNITNGYGGGIANGSSINCILFANSATSSGGGASGGNLYFCTIANNYAGQSGGGFLSDGTVANCIVWGNIVGGSSPNITGMGTVTYSDVQRGFTGTGNINTDPLFVNQATGNLHLTANSPCINQATPDPVYDYYNNIIPFPTTDIDGGSRTVGAKPDMGAYEVGNGGIVGTLVFSGIVASAPAQNVTFQFRPVSGGAATNQTYFTTSDGAFYLHGVPNGSYNLWMKADKYLAVVVPVTVSGGNASGITATLPAGDANNDNIVDVGDFGLLVNAFGATGYDPTTGYDVRADFNGDGNVDIGDFGLLVNGYGDSGAP